MRTVPAVARAIAIIDLVANAAEPPKVAQIAAELGIPRNTTYELVNTLVEGNLVELGADSRVSPGLRLFEWGSAYAQSVDLIQESRRLAAEMAGAGQETVHVARLDGRHVIYLAKEEGHQQIRMGSMVGGRVPAHATGVGKALLAFQPAAILAGILGGPLEQLTPHTVTDPLALTAEFAAIVASGIAYDHEESSPDISCVAAPVRDDTGEVVAALSIATLSSRMTEQAQARLAKQAADGAYQLSRRLGWRNTQEPATHEGLAQPNSPR